MGRVVVGALSVELLTVMDRLPRPGPARPSPRSTARSAPSVVQALAARLAGAGTVMVGAIGDDDLGRACADHLETRGVWTRLVVVQDEATG